jgi:hypothetical protein
VPIIVVELSKARFCGRSLAGFVIVNLARGVVLCLDCVVWCEVEVPATGRSFVQRSPTECGASLCIIYKTRVIRRPGPRRAVAQNEGENEKLVLSQGFCAKSCFTLMSW